ncbi:MAG: zinc metallopeptidase [bacterium]|nr:zinc metallopeptidase [bacterium]
MADWGKILSRGNVEDRRSMAPAAMGGLSLTGIAIVVLLNFFAGGDVGDVLNQLESMPSDPISVQQQNGVEKKEFEGQDSYEVFASTVLGSNNEMWKDIFNKSNKDYEPPKLVLFRSATESGCGLSQSEVGPHYCPADKTIYLDETFFEELTRRFGAKGGDVAEAYVIAHEVAHHAQNEFGIMDEVNSAGRSNSENANQLSVKLELQADCFAGLWANSIKDKDIFTVNEIHEAMDAAAAVGDDRIQKRTSGAVSPESWTHGSSEQRVGWFTKGYESGQVNVCNTFI